jgi:hypothetical protein
MGHTIKTFREGFSLSAVAFAHRTQAGVRVVRHVRSRSLEASHATVARRNMCSEAWQINPHLEADQECLHSKFSQNATVAKGHGEASSMSLFYGVLERASQCLPCLAAKGDDSKTGNRRQEKRQARGEVEDLFEHFLVSALCLDGVIDFRMRVGMKLNKAVTAFCG